MLTGWRGIPFAEEFTLDREADMDSGNQKPDVSQTANLWLGSLVAFLEGSWESDFFFF